MTPDTQQLGTGGSPMDERRWAELPDLEAAGYSPYLANGGAYWVLDGLKFHPATGDWLNERTGAHGTLPDNQTALSLFKRQLPKLPPAEERIVAILRNCAVEVRPCAKCGATIYFLLHPGTGAKTPYSARGISHFIDCQFADQFSRRPAKNSK